MPTSVDFVFNLVTEPLVKYIHDNLRIAENVRAAARNAPPTTQEVDDNDFYYEDEEQVVSGSASSKRGAKPAKVETYASPVTEYTRDQFANATPMISAYSVGKESLGIAKLTEKKVTAAQVVLENARIKLPNFNQKLKDLSVEKIKEHLAIFFKYVDEVTTHAENQISHEETVHGENPATFDEANETLKNMAKLLHAKKLSVMAIVVHFELHVSKRGNDGDEKVKLPCHVKTQELCTLLFHKIVELQMDDVSENVDRKYRNGSAIARVTGYAGYSRLVPEMHSEELINFFIDIIIGLKENSAGKSSEVRMADYITKLGSLVTTCERVQKKYATSGVTGLLLPVFVSSNLRSNQNAFIADMIGVFNGLLASAENSHDKRTSMQLQLATG